MLATAPITIPNLLTEAVAPDTTAIGPTCHRIKLIAQRQVLESSFRTSFDAFQLATGGTAEDYLKPLLDTRGLTVYRSRLSALLVEYPVDACIYEVEGTADWLISRQGWATGREMIKSIITNYEQEGNDHAAT